MSEAAQQLAFWVSEHVGFLVAVALLPLVAYFFQILFGRFLPRQGDWLPTMAMFASFVIALVFFVKTMGVFDPTFMYDSTAHGQGWNWWGTAWDSPLVVGVLYDNLTAATLLMVTMVSFLIHLFSIGYMHGDSRYNVFFANLGLFSFGMLGLVLSDNFLFFFIFWEIMGFCSYSLIGHFYDKNSAANACKKAFLTTRIGDVMLMLGIAILYAKYQTFNFSELYVAVDASVHEVGWTGDLILAGLMIFGGTVGKSSQFPLHVWLPDAMEGPTPVSAMIHAATMVSAGVYLVGRAFLLMSPDVLLVVALIGSFTALFAATIGICQTDIKKVLAYSTISQLGFMVAAIGCGGWIWGIFHMLTHAIFKACLFLGSGSVIHAVHTQEMPEMGGLRRKMPVTYFAMLVSTLAICGIPFFSGFYSKDGIIMSSIARGIHEGSVLFWLPAIFLVVAAVLTAFYMFRLIFLTFHGEPRDEHKYDHAHESPWTMAAPLLILGILAIVCGNFWVTKLATFNFSDAISGERAWFRQLHPEGPSAESYRHARTAIAGGGEDLGQAANDSAARHLRTASTAPLSRAEREFWMDSSGSAPERERAGGVTTSPADDDGEAGGEHGAHGDWEHAQHVAHIPALILSLLAAVIGIGLAMAFYLFRKLSAEAWAKRWGVVYRWVKNKYYVDEFYIEYVIYPLLTLCQMARWVDTWIIDGIVNGVGALNRGIASISGAVDLKIVDGAVNGIAGVSQFCGAVARVVQTGRIQHYIALSVGGMVILAAYFFLT